MTLWTPLVTFPGIISAILDPKYTQKVKEKADCKYLYTLRATVFSSYTASWLYQESSSLKFRVVSFPEPVNVTCLLSSWIMSLSVVIQIELLIEISWRAIDYVVRSSSNFRVCVTNPMVYPSQLTESSISGSAFL